MEKVSLVQIHDSAEVSSKASIGKGTFIWQNCIIQEGAVIGENCSLGANVFIEKGVRIGNGVKVKNNIAIYTGVTCEDNVFLGPNCVFTNVINPRSFINRKSEFQSTVVQKGATIGANATILCGNNIGKYAMVGAGTVVTKDVEDYELVVGNPAKRIGYVCQCGCRLDTNDRIVYVCGDCRKTYRLNAMMEEQS